MVNEINERMLTKDEWEAACLALPEGTTCRACRQALCALQDAKTLRGLAKMKPDITQDESENLTATEKALAVAMISFSLPYPGKAASTNHGYFVVHVGGHARLALTPGAVAFKDEVIVRTKEAIIAAQWHPAPGSQLWVHIEGCFPTRRHSDTMNLAKFVCDSIQDALNCYVEGVPKHNDRDWGLIVEPPQYRPGEARLEVKVT